MYYTVDELDVVIVIVIEFEMEMVMVKSDTVIDPSIYVGIGGYRGFLGPEIRFGNCCCWCLILLCFLILFSRGRIEGDILALINLFVIVIVIVVMKPWFCDADLFD